jgi:hypothetical protein
MTDPIALMTALKHIVFDEHDETDKRLFPALGKSPALLRRQRIGLINDDEFFAHADKTLALRRSKSTRV